MKMYVSSAAKLAITISMALSAIAVGDAAEAKDKIKVGIVSFLTGPAAGPFGVPGKNGAELVIDAINAGKLPGPYAKAGFGGATLEPVFADEAGGNAKQVGEYRNLVQKQGVDAVIGYISSGTCMAVAPVAEELKKLTIISVCGTPRLFEEKDRKYVFRTTAHAVGDGVAAARYVAEKYSGLNGFSGINQNYAWGQDSYKFFALAMKEFSPSITPSSKPQFPKIFAGQYSAEISTLSLDKAKLVHSSFWDGDIEAFVLQAKVRGFFQDKQFLSTVGASAIDNLGGKYPDGVIIGTRGEYGILVRDDKRPLNAWFVREYKKRYGTYPLGPSYQYAKAVLALKIAFDKAAATGAGIPSQEQVIAAMTGLSFDSFGGKVSLSHGKGHQAVHPVGYGITKFNKKTGEPGVTDVKFYSPSCIYPPAGQTSLNWLEAGMPKAAC